MYIMVYIPRRAKYIATARFCIDKYVTICHNMPYRKRTWKQYVRDGIYTTVRDIEDEVDTITQGEFGIKGGSYYRDHYSAASQPNTKRRKKTRVKRKFSGRMPIYYRRRAATYRRRPITRRRRRYVRRKRAVSRRRVRRIAMGVAESKRHIVRINTNLEDADVIDTAISRVPIMASTESGMTAKNRRNGQSVWPRGARLEFLFQNLQTQPLVVHVVVGYKKFDRNPTTNLTIFQDVQTENNIQLNNISAYPEKMFAQLCKKEVRVLKRMRFILTGTDSVELGTDSRNFKVWIPLRGLLQFDGGVSNDEQTRDYHVWMWILNKEGVALTAPTDACRVNMTSVFYYKDP